MRLFLKICFIYNSLHVGVIWWKRENKNESRETGGDNYCLLDPRFESVIDWGESIFWNVIVNANYISYEGLIMTIVYHIRI